MASPLAAECSTAFRGEPFHYDWRRTHGQSKAVPEDQVREVV
jgi:hypothetical protein